MVSIMLAKVCAHVLRLFDLVLGPFEMEAEDGNAELIDLIRVDLAVGLLVGNHVAAAREADMRAILPADFVLERLSVTFMSLRDAVIAADLRHAEAAADLDVIAAREILVLLVEFPPGHINVHAADAVAVVARHAFERRNVPREAVAHRVGEVAPDLSGTVGESVGEQRRLRIQQHARGFAGARRHHHRPAADLLLGARGFIDVRDCRDLAVLSVISSRAMAPVMMFSLPVFMAGKIIAWLEVKADAVRQPRPHWPQ